MRFKDFVCSISLKAKIFSFSALASLIKHYYIKDRQADCSAKISLSGGDWANSSWWSIREVNMQAR
jgi:hypothetical protein